MAKQYIIIGGSAAGMAAAHTIRKKDREGKIIVFSGEKDLPYFRPMIPYIVSGKKQASDIGLSGKGPFTQKGIEFQNDTMVASVDTASKTLSTTSGMTWPWDKILCATGSGPYMPDNIEGLAAKGIYALKTLADARNMADRALETDHAVLLGGGILNLKTAFALLEKNIKVSMLIHSPEILSQLMDPEDALLIRNGLNKAGLSIMPRCSLSQVLTDDKGVKAVVLDNGKELPCQMLCVGKGVVPNTDFLENSGIHTDKGILINAYTACNIKDSYAAGDIALTHDSDTGERVSTALWTHAVEMGACAGLNMTGIKSRYTGTFAIMNASQVADMPFVAIGRVHTRDKDVEVHTMKTELSYRKLVFNRQGDQLVGALFIGDISRAGLYQLLIREKKNVTGIKGELIRHRLHYGHFGHYRN
jgi:NAD(P)H-nitrite reductase large subunit